MTAFRTVQSIIADLDGDDMRQALDNRLGLIGGAIDALAEDYGLPPAPPPRHPAKYSDELLPIFAAALTGYHRVLDPFAGTGRIHELGGHQTIGVELEPEWAALHPDTINGNALALPFPDGSFDAICTSPTYGNRFADHHVARDGSVRHSYTHDLGRTLHPDNTGSLHWGDQYRRLHVDAWREAVRVLRPGGRFVLNISDHIRGGQRMPVSAWHLDHLVAVLGLRISDIVPVATRRLRYGANTERPMVEYVFILDQTGAP